MILHQELVNKEGKTIRGYLDMPDNFNGQLVIMYHGFTGNKVEHARHFVNFSRIIANEGFASLRFDFSGNGESDGEFKDFNFNIMMDEAKQIYEYAKTIKNVKEIIALGFSMGGAVCSALSGIYGNGISKLLLWSPAKNICDLIIKAYEKEEKLPNGNSLHGLFEMGKCMYDSAFEFDPSKNIERFTNPVLLIHGMNDKCVEYIYSIRYSVLYPNSRVHLIATSGHGYDAFCERDELYAKSLEFLKENRK